MSNSLNKLAMFDHWILVSIKGSLELQSYPFDTRLECTISETGPSIPSDEEHAKVQIVKLLGLAEESIITVPILASLPSGLTT